MVNIVAGFCGSQNTRPSFGSVTTILEKQISGVPESPRWSFPTL